jgi:hypothetical protein
VEDFFKTGDERIRVRKRCLVRITKSSLEALAVAEAEAERASQPEVAAPLVPHQPVAALRAEEMLDVRHRHHPALLAVAVMRVLGRLFGSDLQDQRHQMFQSVEPGVLVSQVVSVVATELRVGLLKQEMEERLHLPEALALVEAPDFLRRSPLQGSLLRVCSRKQADSQDREGPQFVGDSDQQDDCLQPHSMQLQSEWRIARMKWPCESRSLHPTS